MTASHEFALPLGSDRTRPSFRTTIVTKITAVVLATWLIASLQLGLANAMPVGAALGMSGPSQPSSPGRAAETAIKPDSGHVEYAQGKQSPPTDASRGMICASSAAISRERKDGNSTNLPSRYTD